MRRAPSLCIVRGAPMALLLGVACSGQHAPLVARTAYEQTYFRASHNWEFRARYESADRLFNAFDYGHAILYETLLLHPADAAQRLEGRELSFIMGRVLRRPPAVPLDEHAIGPRYATLVPEVVAIFEWTHMLHRQIYDVWADEWIGPAQKDAEVHALLRYYGSRKDLALSAQPKSMELMEGQPYSLSFRGESPKFNGLIWSYHWLQMALYDALILEPDAVERHAQVDSTLARFWAMLASPPASMPAVMPMSAAVAPAFSTRYPEAAIIFDNLHSLHDVVADVLASPKVPRSQKRPVILAAAARYRDDTTAVTSREEWLQMSRAMGADRMGGVAVPNVRKP